MPSPNKVLSRRRFGMAASGLALAACWPDAAFAPGLSASGEFPAQRNINDKSQAEIEAKFENIIRKYGDRLSQDQRKKARSILAYHQKLLDSVRAFPVQNGDSPAIVLKLVYKPRKASSKGAKGLES